LEPVSPLTQLLHQGTGAFFRHGIVQATHGSVDEQLAQRRIDRFPDERTVVAGWDAHRTGGADRGIAPRSRRSALFAKHDGCLISTPEGLEDAVAAFPEAMTLVVSEAPSVSDEFAGAVRRFCEANSNG
jgi:hypothetical protein